MTNTLRQALDEFVHSPLEVLAAVVAVIGAVSAAFKAGRRFWGNFWARMRSRPAVPKETLRIVQDFHQSRWARGSSHGAPAMQVIFEGHVTDISGKPNRVLRAQIPKPRTQALMLLLSNNHNATRPRVLQANECAEIHAMFFVQPVVGKDEKPWQTPIVFIDQYGNPHKVKNCLFKALQSPPPSDSTVTP